MSMWRNWNPPNFDGNVKWCNTKENSLVFPQKVKHLITPCYPAILLLGVYPKELKAGTQTDAYMSVFIGALFIITKRWKQTKYLSTDGWTKCDVYMQWNMIIPLKGMKFWYMLHGWTLKTCKVK